MSKSSLIDTPFRMDLTPPIRRVAADALSSIEINNINTNQSKTQILKTKQKNSSHHLIKQSTKKNNNEPASTLHQRSISSSSISTSSSNNDSLESFSHHTSLNHDDDESSNDDTNQQWDLDQLMSHIPLTQLLDRDSLTFISDNRIDINQISQCKICLEELSMESLKCCSSSICSKCIYRYLSLNIIEGRIRIICPSCPYIFTREEILFFLSKNENDGNIAERYKRFYSDINGESHIKTCPRCCSIKEIDRKLIEGIHRTRNIPRKVICNECQFEWCFFCHSPWHEKMNCKEYQQGEKMLQLWASQMNQNQQNAKRCPRCKIYISRNGGCPHMVCTKCQCDFCYNCGRRRLDIRFLGSHESRFSPFGCKYNLYPNKPILRRTVRGLIAGAATLAIPVAAVGAVALLAVGTTIAAPTYGTYRLVKHIRSKRQEQQRRQQQHIETMSMQSTIDDHLSTHLSQDDQHDMEVDEIQRALQASLITYKQEIHKREQIDVTPFTMKRLSHLATNVYNEDEDDDDDDDDSFDD